MSPTRSPAFAILTPIPIEWEAMCQLLVEPSHAYTVTLPAAMGTIGPHTVICVQTGKGESSTSTALDYVFNNWEPNWVLLVGVAGGFGDQEVKLGDVVVARHVYYLEYGKIKAGTYNRLPDYDYSTDRSLLAYAETLAKAGNRSWIERIHKVRPDSQPLAATTVHVGYVGSMDKVVDDPDAALFQMVRNACSTPIHAVEMEGSGAGASKRLEQARRAMESRPAVGLLMIRGISDQPPGSDPQRDEWKSYAAAAAAAFVEGFLLSVPVQGKRKLHKAPARRSPKTACNYDYDSLEFVQKKIQIPIPWGETNHSKYEIALKSVSKAWRREIQDAASRYFGAYVDKINDVLQIDEDSGSANFPVFSERFPPILFRVNRRLKTQEAIQTIASLSEYFYQKGVLPDSPVRESIVPLKASAQFPQGCPSIWGYQGKKPYLTALLSKLAEKLALGRAKCLIFKRSSFDSRIRPPGS